LYAREQEVTRNFKQLFKGEKYGSDNVRFVRIMQLPWTIHSAICSAGKI
jgi:hypothetical protein